MRAGWMRPSCTSRSRLMRAISPADRVEAAHDHHARRVVDDHVHAGRLLEAADVPPLAADHPALHVVAGDGHRADRVVAGLLGGVALDRLEDDLPALLLGLFLGLLGDALDQRPGLLPALVLDPPEQHFLGLLGGHAGDLQQPVALLLEHGRQLLLLGRHRLLALASWLSRSSRCFSLTESVSSLRSSVSSRLASRRLVLVELAAGGLVVPLELVLEPQLLLLGGQLDFLGLALRLLDRASAGVVPPPAWRASSTFLADFWR